MSFLVHQHPRFEIISSVTQSENNKTVILSMDERLSLIEEQIDIVDETNNDTITDIASSIQAVTEEIVLRIVKNLAEEYKIKNLCLAGGVALNCVANGKILKNN